MRSLQLDLLAAPLPPAAGMAASVLLADAVYDVSCNVILDSAMRAISAWDVVTSMIKCWVFGTIISTGALAAQQEQHQRMQLPAR